jgi:Tfp pilus assembly protein PilF
VLASEVARLAGGPAALCRRALEVAANGDLRLATQLVEWAATADPTSVEVHGTRAEIYKARRADEQSLMAQGIYGWAASTSDAVVAEGNSAEPG